MRAAAPAGAAHMRTPTQLCLAVRCTLHACVLILQGCQMIARASWRHRRLTSAAVKMAPLTQESCTWVTAAVAFSCCASAGLSFRAGFRMGPIK